MSVTCLAAVHLLQYTCQDQTTMSPPLFRQGYLAPVNQQPYRYTGPHNSGPCNNNPGLPAHMRVRWRGMPVVGTAVTPTPTCTCNPYLPHIKAQGGPQRTSLSLMLFSLGTHSTHHTDKR